MRARHAMLVGLSTIALASCGQSEREQHVTERVTTVDVEEPASDAPANEFGFYQAQEEGIFSGSPPPPQPRRISPPPPAPAPATVPGQPVPGEDTSISVSMPQVAYTYSYGFRVPANVIRPLQERHADMCEAKGPQVCRIVSMNSEEMEGDYAYGSLRIAIASSEARTFGKALTAASKGMDGELVSSSIDGEDLSKKIVDTEARLRARTVLRDRLMEVLRNRQGTVAELVEAERGVAKVNEEIDQARSWLNEMRGRVAYSTMTLEYEAGTPSQGGFADPIRNAWGSLASILGNLIAFLMVVGIVVIPIGLIIWGAVRLFKRIKLSTGIGDDGWLPPTDKPDETKAD